MNDDFQTEEERWITCIGRFIIDFAYIEESLYRVIQSHLKNTQISYKNLRDKFDSNYVDLFKNIFISDISQTEEVRKLIKEFTTKANNLRPIRNTIAHNSLGLMFERKETGEMEIIGFEIEDKTKQNISINYDTFVKHMGALKVCRSNLEKLMEIFQNKEDAMVIANLSNEVKS